MVTLPIEGRSVMVGDRTVEGARQILMGNYRFVRHGQAWSPIEEADWQSNVPSIELTPTSILGLDGEEFEESVPYGTELTDLLGERVTALTEEQRELIALTDMLNKVPPRKLEGLGAEELVEMANEEREQFEDANGMVRFEDGDPAPEDDE